MEKIRGLLNSLKPNNDVYQPLILDLKKLDDYKKAVRLLKNKNIQKNDSFKGALEELFAINNPGIVYTKEYPAELGKFLKRFTKKTLALAGKWIYFPWLNTIVHVLDEQDFLKVRTARNKNLIDRQEQENFYNCVIGIAGLSVGNNVALALAMQGAGKHFKLADFDELSLSNTNRIRAGVQNLSLKKVVMTARQIYEINPYSHVEIFPDGLNESNIGNFFRGSQPLSIVIDEMDNLAMKLLLRKYAQKNRIAIVMGADNGDNAVIDVERHDLPKKVPFFHNRMGKVSYKKLKKLDKFGIGRLITKFVGAENVTIRMQESLLEMGKTIVSWPQLGGAAMLNGIAVAYCVRKILNNQPVEDNRSLIFLDELLTPDYNSQQNKKRRQMAAKKFKAIFKL